MSFKRLLKPNIALAAITAVYAFFALFNLGSTTAPQTFYQSTDSDRGFRVDFETAVNVAEIYAYTGIGDQFSQPEGEKINGTFNLFYSADGSSFEYLCDIAAMEVFTWRQLYTGVTAKSILVQTGYSGQVLYEIAFADHTGKLHSATVTGDSTNPYGAHNAMDENSLVPPQMSYYYSMYFDEIYHGRTAFEQLNGYTIYETTHPPLGKILISLGISLFGMTPFGWRIVGALCGVAMVPLVYLLVTALCKKRWAGCFGAALLALDFMHLTQTRIATVDTYVVLFMLLTFLFMAQYHNTAFGDKREWLHLALSGFFMGCCVASKWNGAYPMVGLALFFFVSLYLKYKNSPKTKQQQKYVVQTLILCCVFFVAVPLTVYTLSYIPVVHADSAGDYLRQVVSYQIHMFNYHSKLEAEHFFSSMWYTWPFNIKPIWYAINTTGNTASSISAFGNPAIWVLTPFAALYCLYRGVKNKQYNRLLVAFGYLASYLPWVMVSRLCFIYHYFPCAVFGIVALALAVCDFAAQRPKTKWLAALYLCICMVLFGIFLPVTSGMQVQAVYLDFLEFLPQWHFVNL